MPDVLNGRERTLQFFVCFHQQLRTEVTKEHEKKHKDNVMNINSLNPSC